MTTTLSLLPIYVVIGVLGVVVAAIVIFVQTSVRISHILAAQARAIEEIAEALRSSPHK
jgi:putative flippase GtrA